MSKVCDRLVTDNINLVHHIAKNYRGIYDYEDLVQEGTIGLIKAAKKFDPSLNIKFSCYAIPSIRGEILHFIRDKANIIKPRRGEKAASVLSLDRQLENLDSPAAALIDTIAASEKVADPELELVREFIKTLPEKEQLLFNMKLNGADNKVIAEKLNISAMTITRHLERLKRLAKEWIEAFNNNLQPIVIEPKIRTEVRGRSAQVIQIEPTVKEKTKWENLRIDIKVVFDIYLKSPNWRSTNRCIDALYKFGQIAIKRKYWHLNSSDKLDNVVSWEDLLHESICKLRQALIDRKIQSHEHGIAMLYVFAKYSYWGMLKQSAKYTSLNKTISPETDTTLEDFVASTIAAITPERSEDLEIIETALAKLPPINKQVIELAWIEGKTVTQISQQMQVTVPFVSNIIQKSRITIARELTGRKMSLGY